MFVWGIVIRLRELESEHSSDTSCLVGLGEEASRGSQHALAEQKRVERSCRECGQR